MNRLGHCKRTPWRCGRQGRVTDGGILKQCMVQKRGALQGVTLGNDVGGCSSGGGSGVASIGWAVPTMQPAMRHWPPPPLPPLAAGRQASWQARCCLPRSDRSAACCANLPLAGRHNCAMQCAAGQPASQPATQPTNQLSCLACQCEWQKHGHMAQAAAISARGCWCGRPLPLPALPSPARLAGPSATSRSAGVSGPGVDTCS